MPLLFANGIRHIFSWPGSVYFVKVIQISTHNLLWRIADFFFFFFLICILMQDYFIHFEVSLLLGWAETGDPQEKLSDHP